MTAPTPEPDHTATPTAALVERVRSRIDALTDPCVTRTRRWVREDGVDHLVRREATVTLPPLLVQLETSLVGSTSGLGGASTKSRPPGSLEGTDCLRTIDREARQWAALIMTELATWAMPGVKVEVRARTLRDALQVIRFRAPDLDREDLTGVDRDVRSWWISARIATTWERPPLRPFVPCPGCKVRGGLRVIETPLAILCRECGGTWDASTAAELSTIYQLAFAEPIADPQPAVPVATP